MDNAVSEKNFSLSKVKVGKGGGLDVHFETVETFGNEAYTEKHHLESAKDVHPDLANLFKDMRPIIARIFNLTSFLSMVEAPDYKANASQKDSARDFADQLLDNIEVRGISLSGKDDNIGVVITSILTVKNGQKSAINTPRIKLSSSSYGFEEELEEIIGEIEKETYLFLFKGKKAQLELFDPPQDGKSAASGEYKEDPTDDDDLNEEEETEEDF